MSLWDTQNHLEHDEGGFTSSVTAAKYNDKNYIADPAQ